MKTKFSSLTGLTLLEVLVVITLIVILVAVSVPSITGTACGSRSMQTVNNARQIYLASFQMAADNAVSGNPLLGWPGDQAASKVEPVNSVPEFAARAMKYDYIKQGDLGKVFHAPGIPIYKGQGVFKSENSAFKIYKVRESDVSQCVFAATKNFTFGRGLDATKLPYGDKACVIMRKGGDGLTLGKLQAPDKALVGFMPGSGTQQSPGEEAGNVWE